MDTITSKIITSVLLIGSFFLLGEAPDNLRFKEMLDSALDKEVVIVFNSGGWGNTPLDQADDFRPIIEGIESKLQDSGYSSVVVSYERTKKGFFGAVEGAKEAFTFFQRQSRMLADEIDSFVESNPQKKVILAGLSNGGTFTDKVMEKIPEDKRSRVFAIEVGTPFWEQVLNSDNVLLLDNQGQDPLSNMDLTVLIPSLLEAPIKWTMAKVSGNDLSFGHALKLPGHHYSWEQVGTEISLFLDDKLAI